MAKWEVSEFKPDELPKRQKVLMQVSVSECEFSTTISLWLINLTTSKELPSLLLKLYNDGAIGISRIFLDFASVL